MMENLIKIFSGNEASALLLKKRLEQAGIDALIKNDSVDAFLGTAPQIVDLYIQEAKLNKGREILSSVIDSF